MKHAFFKIAMNAVLITETLCMSSIFRISDLSYFMYFNVCEWLNIEPDDVIIFW